MASAMAIALGTAPANATTLTLDQFKVSHASGAALPPGFPATISAAPSASAESVTMTGSVGPISRPAWLAENISFVRLQFSGRVLDGVAAGDGVSFNFGLSIFATRGSVSYMARGNAAVPPAQGFIIGPSATVQADPSQPVIVAGSFGRTFLSDSTGDGTYSMYIDLSWNGANAADTLSIQVLYATTHLPGPSALALVALGGIGAARRRRPGA